jgi:RNA polymerase sigma factor (sigma-70 family)
MVEPDAALWKRVRDGDAQAFGLIFECHAGRIYNYCFRRTANWAMAEDLMSLVFLEAWRRRDKLRQDDKVLPWLYGIATNVVRNSTRSVRRYRAALDRLPLGESVPDFSAEADDRLDDERRMSEILEALVQLSKRQREVLALCDWSGLSYEDAAGALGIPVGTVRSTLSRARARLTELLEGPRTLPQ